MKSSSMIAYWTHSLWLCKLMFCIFIPAIYFYIGPCFGLLNNLAPCHMRNMFIAISLLVANIFNLIVAPWVVGALSDWFAGSHATDAASTGSEAAASRSSSHRFSRGRCCP